jgi:hypothetical protein
MRGKIAMQVFEWTKTELEAKETLKKYGAHNIARPDWLCQHPHKNFWFLVEVKEQERFQPRRADGSLDILGPGGGHGISIFQYERREKFRKATGVRTLLVIKEVPTGLWLCEYLDELAKGPVFRTNVNNKIIFALRSFSKMNRNAIN